MVNSLILEIIIVFFSFLIFILIFILSQKNNSDSLEELLSLEENLIKNKVTKEALPNEPIFNEILYMENNKGICKITTYDDNIITANNFNKILREMPFGFVRVGSKIWVNRSYIKKFGKDSITFLNNSVLYFSHPL